MATASELLQAFDDVISSGVRHGLVHNTTEDDRLDGRIVTVNGQKLINFGSCSYLGLEMHPALKAAVADAAERYGTQFSSSRAYLSSPAYVEAEQTLSTLFGRPTLITSSTTMGHIATMPTIIHERDALILDHQVHNSVQTAAKLAQVQGTAVELLPHSNLDRLEKRIQDLSKTHRRIWYAADGLYSMYADFAPIEGLNALVERNDQLWLYLDDAHAVSWTGQHGRGYVLDRLSQTAAARSVVAGSLNKSFAAAGGALTFPDEEMCRRVFSLGGPMIFSGPVQPPMLGAIIASAKLHLSDEIVALQQYLVDLIRLFNRLAIERGLPLISDSEAPIRMIGAGVPEIAYNLVGRLRNAGYFVDTASYPAVAAKRSGARITLTAHHTAEDVVGLIDALCAALPAALADEGGSAETLQRVFGRQLVGRRIILDPAPAAPVAVSNLRLETHTTIQTVDRVEWDRLLGDRGVFGWSGMATFEAAFDRAENAPEHRWAFKYWIVRDDVGQPVAATFFTITRWKDDMLSAAVVSAEVERRRTDDPMYLTSTMVGMGSLLSEGDHLYLDRTGDWKGALRLILAAARDEEDRSGASAVVLRDLPDGDTELHEFLVDDGFVRIPVYDTWVREIDFADDAEFLAGLSKKHRYHQRVNVLGWEGKYKVESVLGGSEAARQIGTDERDRLYTLYRNVHARNLDLNVFPLPRQVFDAILAQPCWELSLLRLVDGPDDPVAFAVQYLGSEHVAPLFVGLLYEYVASHHSYQQTLWQAIRSAQRHGAKRVLLGMSADLQKARFGAIPEKRWAYIQPTESYQADVLNQITERVTGRQA
jgi:7-keto-8-aminopelargonate synthetase-like enzyme